MHASGQSGHFTDTIWRPFFYPPAKFYTLFAFVFVLLIGALISTRLLDYPALRGSTNEKLRDRKSRANSPEITKIAHNKTEYPLNCTAGSNTKTCPGTYPISFTPEEDLDGPPAPTCPDYFRWIHEDLRPWARTGITREMVERAGATADFRLAIVKGRVYVVRNNKAFESRDTLTLWGILQLLRKYPGKIPDLDIMFDCVDWPILLKHNYSAPGAPAPPPLFRYCGNDKTLDIVFPDWSFWGWYD